jgi:diguanylate cyclase (GGDEF)-like protein
MCRMSEEFTIVESGSPDAAPVFILSFRQREEVAAAAAGGGWRVVAARRADSVDRRFLASGAAVAVIDARGALSDGLEAAKALGPTIEAHGAAMLILVSQSDTVHMRHFYDAGATHFLSSPMSSAAMAHAIRFAARHVDRLAGWNVQAKGGPTEPLGWRYDPEMRSLQLTPGLAALLSMSEAPGPRILFARLEPEDRERARSALRRLDADTPSTAFAHDLPGVGRVVQHLQFDPRTRRLHALVEALGVAPDANAAVRDALTGARDGPSARRWIDRRLGEGRDVRIILAGMARFETVNRAYGRAVGDELLRNVSRRTGEAARDTLGKDAIVARIGGSEFLIASDSADDAQVAAAAARIEEALARPFVAGGEIVTLGARLVRAQSATGDTAASLLRRAGEALLGDAPQESGAPPLDALVDSLHRALERGEIRVLFQPQVSIATGQVVGVEALARWNHPEHGELGAETLFAAANRAGLDATLSDHVQRRALAAAANWPMALNKLRLSINVTAADVARPGFADQLLGRIDASGFPRARLTLEITESGIMSDLSEAARLLTTLRAAGCRVAIDDFGTGYSSLAYLKALPLDYLKIDKKLSQDITGSARDRVVVRGVIDMARSLGLAVVAEGVETKEQLDLLAKEGCQYFQGFLCSEPIDVPALMQTVAKAAA